MFLILKFGSVWSSVLSTTTHSMPRSGELLSSLFSNSSPLGHVHYRHNHMPSLFWKCTHNVVTNITRFPIICTITQQIAFLWLFPYFHLPQLPNCWSFSGTTYTGFQNFNAHHTVPQSALQKQELSGSSQAILDMNQWHINNLSKLINTDICTE